MGVSVTATLQALGASHVWAPCDGAARSDFAGTLPATPGGYCNAIVDSGSTPLLMCAAAQLPSLSSRCVTDDISGLVTVESVTSVVSGASLGAGTAAEAGATTYTLVLLGRRSGIGAFQALAGYNQAASPSLWGPYAADEIFCRGWGTGAQSQPGVLSAWPVGSIDCIVVRIAPGASPATQDKYTMDSRAGRTVTADVTRGAVGTLKWGLLGFGVRVFAAAVFVGSVLTDAQVTQLRADLIAAVSSVGLSFSGPAYASGAYRVQCPGAGVDVSGAVSAGGAYTVSGLSGATTADTRKYGVQRRLDSATASAPISLQADGPSAGTTAASAAIALAVPGISITPQGSGRPLVTVSRVDHGGTIRAVTLSELWDYCHAWMSADATRYPLAVGAFDGYTLRLDCDLRLESGFVALHGETNQQVVITGDLTQDVVESICSTPITYSSGTKKTSVLRIVDVAVVGSTDIVTTAYNGPALVVSAGGLGYTSDAAFSLPDAYRGMVAKWTVSPSGRAPIVGQATISGQTVVISANTQISVSPEAVKLALAGAQPDGVTPAAGSVYQLLSSGGGGGATPDDVAAARDAVIAALPSAASNASAVRANLALELARIDAAVSSRAAPGALVALIRADLERSGGPLATAAGGLSAEQAAQLASAAQAATPDDVYAAAAEVIAVLPSG